MCASVVDYAIVFGMIREIIMSGFEPIQGFLQIVSRATDIEVKLLVLYGADSVVFKSDFFVGLQMALIFRYSLHHIVTGEVLITRRRL